MKTIEIVVSPTGETRVETKGFSGSACRDASKFLEQALGKRTNEQLKASGLAGRQRSFRLVDERETRRRPGLLGWAAISVAAGQRLSRASMVHGHAARVTAGRRTVAGSQIVPANREHRPPA